MPRIRTIKPEFWRNRQLANISAFTRLVAIAILNVADDEGYFEADPALIRGDVFPYEYDYGSITVALRELSGIGYVVFRTSSEKGELGYVPNFKKHQVINKPGRSKLKEIYEKSQEITPLQNDSRSTTVALPEHYRLEQGTGNREKEVEKEHEYSSELSQAAEPVDTSLVFECVGKNGGIWNPSLKMIDQFRDWYPTIDVDAELRKAAAWHASNPKQRKTKSGMQAFLNGWLTRATNKGPPSKSQSPSDYQQVFLDKLNQATQEFK